MTDKQCQGCQRGLPVHNGIHCGEWEYESCKRLDLQLVPIERDIWHEPKANKSKSVPFTFGG